jgi:hypothetical protein
VVEYNPISSEGEIPKNHRIPQKRVYPQWYFQNPPVFTLYNSKGYEGG